MEYHRTKDILHVKERLGHRSITSTMLYTHIIQTTEKEEYASKVATTIEEMKNLIELGFEYITETKVGQTTYKLFRKKKIWRPS